MDDFEEMAQMQKIVEAIGDEPPTPEEVDASEGIERQAAPDATDTQVVNQEPEDTVTQEEDASSVMDNILGLNKPEGVTGEQTPPAEEPAEDPVTGEMVSKERFNEVNERANRQQVLIEKMAQKSLDTGGDGSMPDGEEEGQVVPDGLDKDTLSYMRKHMNHLIETGQIDSVNDLRKSLEPIKEQRESDELVAAIAVDVPGFEGKHLPGLQKTYDALPEDEKPKYKGSLAGAILLAERMSKSGALGTLKKKATVKPIVNRHRSEAASAGAVTNMGNSEDEQLEALNKLPDDEFLKFLAPILG